MRNQDDSTTTDEAEPVIINVLAKDTVGGIEIDPATAAIAILDEPVNGQAVVNQNQTVTFAANADVHFPFFERFTHRVMATVKAVSYTHLTLPTIYSV